MNGIDKIKCDRHGDNVPCYVCVHVVDSLLDQQVRGYHWVLDEENDIQAFCEACWHASEEE